ncbi:unnamed protein product [Rhizopus microsporus]
MPATMSFSTMNNHYDSVMNEHCKVRPDYRKTRHSSLIIDRQRRGMRPVRSTQSLKHHPHSQLRKDFMHILPYEIIFQIISYLDIQTLCNLFTVSKAWYRIARSNEAWKMQFYNTFYVKSDFYDQSFDWQHIYKQHHILNTRWTRGQVVTHYLIGHLDSVYCLQFDKNKLITGSRDRSIKLWDLNTYQCLHTLYGHDASVLCLKYDNRIMVSGSSDTTIIVWSMQTLQPITRLYGHTAGVLDVCFDDRHIVSCSKDGTIRIWDIFTGQLLRTLLAHRGPVNAIQLVDDRLVSASGDGLIKMWDITTGECLRKYVGHTRGLACVKFDGKRIVSGSNDKTIKVWDAGVRCMFIYSS